ncbi:MAG: ATP-binding protein [Prevotellaceae bacterium]|nr:ATP-binding protein [Prevotellaceae bacterium]
MEKEVIQRIIIENQYVIKKSELIKRNFWSEPNLNFVFTGLRRAGKSYCMLQIAQQLLSEGHDVEEFLYFNFEDDRLDTVVLSDLDLIKRTYEEMFDHQPIFFLDEIQIVERWEKFARRLADSKFRVYITGSNAKMLSGDVATTLGGRYMICEVFPFSFDEYLLAHGIDLQEKNAQYKYHAEISKHFQQYFRFGGLPEQINVQNRRAWLSSLYQKIYLGDIVARYQVRQEISLRLLIKKLAESVKQPASYNRLANIVSSAGKKITSDTVIDYISHIKDSYLIFSVENYVAKMADKESNKKYYFTDNGILNLFLLDADTSLLENQVAIYLHKLYGEQVYYLKGKTEIDFYVPKHKKAIQVSYSMKDIDTRKREINGLTELSKSNFEINSYLIITKDEEEIISEQGIEIQVIPVMKWLIQNN